MDTFAANFNVISDDVSHLSQHDLRSLIEKLDHEYHELGNPSVSDDRYDSIRETYETKFGPLKRVGHPVHIVDTTGKDQVAVTLPFYMASMNKLKADGLGRWKSKYPGVYVVSDKLDGVSALYHEGNLFTRGNGRVGRDISSLLPHLRLPNVPGGVTIRGELVIGKRNFNALVDDEVLTHRSNPRNTVAGCVNAVRPNEEILPRIDFVAFEIVHPRMTAIDQIERMRHHGFKVVHSVRVAHLDDLPEILVDRKQTSEYDIDGVVVQDSSRAHDLKADSNPSHAFAFKLPSSFTQATVKGVEWNISKDKLAKPTVLIEPVLLDGIRIARTTGFNGKFIVENNIGPGTIIEITRSGDVIPHIRKIVMSTTAQLPNFKYRMTGNGTDIEVIDKSNDVLAKIALKRFQNTVEKLDIKGLKSATVQTLFEAGVRSVKQLFDLDETSLQSLRLSGFKRAKVSNVIDGIRAAKDKLTCLKLMIASNSFGKGLSGSKLSAIFSELRSKVIDADTDVTVDDVIAVEGIGPSSAAQFVKNLPAFRKFIHDNALHRFCDRVPANPEDVSHDTPPDSIEIARPLTGSVFCFSGGSSPAAERLVECHGGSIVSSFTRTCSHLIMLDKSKSTSKSMKARKYGIPIVDMADLKKMVAHGSGMLNP